MPRSFIALGGNLGETAVVFSEAISALDSLPQFRFVARSSWYRSGSMGASAGDVFLNAVAEFESDLAPPEQLAALHDVEAKFGRTRSIVWGPRTLDLDLLYCDDRQYDTATLKLPHPHAWYRRFVLEPMCEIAPEFVHPRWKESQNKLLDRINRRPLIVRAVDTPRVSADWDSDFPGVRVEYGGPLTDDVLCVTSSAEVAANSTIPVIDLRTIPGDTTAAIRRVLESTLGECVRMKTA